MTLLERMLEKFSPPLDSALIISLTSELPDTSESEPILIETLSNLSQEAQQSTPPQTTDSDPSDHHDSNQSLIQQVQSIFPNLSPLLIQRAISNTSSELNEVIDYLQATEFEDENQVTATCQVQPSSTPTRSRKIKKNKKLLTVHLNDVQQREAQNRLKQPRIPDQIDNAWVSGDSRILHISKLLGIDAGKIYSTYHTKACNLVLTLEEIFSRLELKKRIEITKDEERSDELKIQLDFLRTMLPDNDDEMLTRLLIITDLESGNAYDLWLFLSELQDRDGTLVFNQFFFSNSNHDYHSSSDLSVNKKSKSNSKTLIVIDNNNTNTNTNNDAWMQISQPTNVISTNTSGYSVNYCSTMVNELSNKVINKRLTVNKAVITGQSCINKKSIAGSIALINRERNEPISNKLKEWEFNLVKAIILERQNNLNNFDSIDLHGLTTNQATLITSQFLFNWWNRVQHSVNVYNSGYKPFHIITGAGSHSMDFKPRLLLCITRLLEQEGWKFKPKNDFNGLTGCLIVYGIQKNSR